MSMNQNPNIDMDKIMRAAKSEAGQKLLAMFQAHAQQQGDSHESPEAMIRQFIATPEAAALVKQLEEL